MSSHGGISQNTCLIISNWLRIVMSRLYRTNSLGVLSAGLIFAVLIIGLLSLWTDRNLEYYLSMYKGEAVDIPYAISVLITIVLNAVIFGLNVLGEILRYFM